MSCNVIEYFELYKYCVDHTVLTRRIQKVNFDERSHGFATRIDLLTFTTRYIGVTLDKCVNTAFYRIYIENRYYKKLCMREFWIQRHRGNEEQNPILIPGVYFKNHWESHCY